MVVTSAETSADTVPRGLRVVFLDVRTDRPETSHLPIATTPGGRRLLWMTRPSSLRFLMPPPISCPTLFVGSHLPGVEMSNLSVAGRMLAGMGDVDECYPFCTR